MSIERSAIFSLLLEKSPAFARTEMYHGSNIVSAVQADWEQSKSKNMQEFIERWLARHPMDDRAPCGYQAEDGVENWGSWPTIDGAVLMCTTHRFPCRSAAYDDITTQERCQAFATDRSKA